MKVTDYMNELRKSQKSKKFESKIVNWDEKFWFSEFLYLLLNFDRIDNLEKLDWNIYQTNIKIQKKAVNFQFNYK